MKAIDRLIRIFPEASCLAVIPCGRTLYLYLNARDGKNHVSPDLVVGDMVRQVRIPGEHPKFEQARQLVFAWLRDRTSPPDWEEGVKA